MTVVLNEYMKHLKARSDRENAPGCLADERGLSQ